MTRKRTHTVINPSLLSDISRMIEDARSAVAVTVNTGLTILYWQIGKRINEGILKGERAEYGEEIVATLSRQLVEAYGRGLQKRTFAEWCSSRTLSRMPKLSRRCRDN